MTKTETDFDTRRDEITDKLTALRVSRAAQELHALARVLALSQSGFRPNMAPRVNWPVH